MYQVVLILIAGCCAWLSGCALLHRSEVEVLHVHTSDAPDEQARSEAVEKFRLAERQMDHGFGSIAEKMLNEAIQLDPGLGPAHNNLGLIYLSRRQLYEAAHAFHTACVTMPNSPIPENNLGLTLEEGGKLDEAIEHYGRAHFLAPTNAEFLGNLVRARRIRGDNTDDVASMLHELVYLETRPDWVEWAQDELNLTLPLEHQILPTSVDVLTPDPVQQKPDIAPPVSQPLSAPLPELVPFPPDSEMSKVPQTKAGSGRFWLEATTTAGK